MYEILHIPDMRTFTRFEDKTGFVDEFFGHEKNHKSEDTQSVYVYDFFLSRVQLNTILKLRIYVK